MEMPVFPLPSPIAWGDESARTRNKPPMYLMCATSFEPGSEDAIERFAREKPAGMRKLHWYDMNAREKARSLDAIAEIPHWNAVAITSPMPLGPRPERARRKCLERLLPHLERAGVDTLILEGRWKQEDEADLEMQFALRNRKMIERIRIEHMRPDAGEPRLWVPDQVLGAVGDVLCGSDDRWAWDKSWAKIDDRVTLLIETLR